MTTNVTVFDAAEYLATPEDIAAYLEAVFATGEQKTIQMALGTVARSKGISALATQTGLSRETLYKALSEEGDPRFSTLKSVLNALGLQLSIVPISAPEPASV